ncbi:MAG: ABC transporter permease [Candidatus Aminicenantes bacterium]|jgi:putative ABC transport system permease protein
MKSRQEQHPRFSQWLFSFMKRYDEEFVWAGDLEEEFNQIVEERGLSKARRWYRAQVFKTIPAYFKFLMHWATIMSRHYLITAYRHMKRQRCFTIINVAGLAIGLTFFILIMIYVQFELSYDRYHKKAQHIYRVASELPAGHTHGGKTAMTRTVSPLAPTMKEEFPEVANATRFTRNRNVLLTYNKTNFLEKEVIFAEPQVFEMFSLPLKRGQPETALNEPYSIILSQRMAEHFFGRENPMGKIIRYENSQDLKVTAILQDMPQNSHFVMDIIIPLQAYALIRELDLTKWQNHAMVTYIQLNEGVNAHALEQKIPGLFRKYAESDLQPGGRRYCRPFLQALTSLHLHSDLDGEFAPNSNIKNIYLFSTIAFLILIIACINYMNLATARSTQRGKEVAIRKVVGALRHHLVKQFYGESFVFLILALTLSLALVQVLLPAFSAFVERDLSFSLLISFPLFLGLLITAGFMNFLAGSYPALLISSFRPAFVLKKQMLNGLRSSRLRNALVVFQFVVSVGLIVSAVVVRMQLDFIKSKDVGYEKDQIVILRLHDQDIKKSLDALKSELKTNPDVIAATASDALPNNIQSQMGPKWPGMPEDFDYFDVYVSYVDEDYMDVYGIDVVDGRNFSKEFPSDAQSAFLFNESLVNTLGWDQPLGREFEIWWGDVGKVVGVVRNFNFHSLHRGIDPMCLYYRKDQRYVYYLSVKIRGGRIPETLGFLKDTWEKFSPNYPIDYSFFDDIFDNAYRSEYRLGSMFNIFSLLAVAIACLGLFGLAAFTAEQRTKEIGIRKVLGASGAGIFMLLSKEFAKWVLISSLIAWPIAYYAMHSWLQNFAYRAPLAPWIFIAATGAAAVVALGTVASQTVKVASTNPVNVLRYE